MPTRNVVLSDHLANMVAKLVQSGRYQNASEVVREGLRLVERREVEDELRLEAMRDAAATGIADIEAGRYSTFETREGLHEALSLFSAETLGAEKPDNSNT